MKRLANYLIAMALMAFTFTSCEDVPNPFGQILPPGGAEEEAVVVPATGSGTLTDPYNVTKVVEVVSAYADNAESPTDVYIEGIVKSIKEQYGTQYGNATFDIQDVENGEASFTIYRALYLGNEKYTDDSATKLNEGDKVIICGKVTKYVNASSGQVTLETKQNAAYLYSLNGKGGGDTPAPTETIGTKDEPITVAKALELINALADNGTTDKDAYVTGKITKIITTDANIAQYKNIDYMISDGTNELKVFRGKNIDNTDFTEAGQISVGDEVVVLGKLMKYAKDGNIEPEVAQGNYIVKLTKGSGGGGGDTPAPTGDNLIANGDFESWTGDAPDNWNGVAGNATLEKSTDVHGGSAALLIKSNSANKRLSYKAIKLKKGTYHISLYAKAVTGTSKIAPGYVAIINGAPDSQNYMYIETYPEVGTSWTKIDHSFTLGADTEVCLVIMKHKSTSNDVIIDDYSLTSSDGGLIDGGDTPGGGDTPAPTGAYLDESFANGKGNFTIDDKVFSGVWTAASYGSDSYMMATSYVKADGESAKTNHDAESWLISPEIDLSSATNPVLTFAQVINKFFGTIAEEAMVFAKKENGNWTKLTITYPATPSSSFSKFTDDGANVSVSLADYKSSKTQIAFVYKGSSTKAGTWEIKDVKVAEATR